MLHISFGAAAVGVGAASCYSSGSTKMMRLRPVDTGSNDHFSVAYVLVISDPMYPWLSLKTMLDELRLGLEIAYLNGQCSD
jgi:hypothetical protein